MPLNDPTVVVDEQDNEIAVMSRAEAHDRGLLHRVACIYVLDPKGRILIQERKDGYLDHSSAGHVDPGESYDAAARRELFEELGIRDVPLEYVGSTTSLEGRAKKEGNLRHFFGIYRCTAEPVVLAPAEVKSVFWAEPDTIWRDMLEDSGCKKYTAGFKATLRFFLDHQKRLSNEPWS